jgi:hypothetical protein
LEADPVPDNVPTTTTTVTVRDHDADGQLRSERITVVKAGLKTVTERSFDADGTRRSEKITTTESHPTLSFRFDPGSFLGY